MRGNLKTTGPAFWLSLVPVLGGLGASAALAVDHAQPSPVFCSEGGGCDALRHTGVATALGVPLPVVGLVGFGLLALAVLLPGRAARIVQGILASGAALVGAVLLAAQVVLGHFCPYCFVADAGAIAAAVAACWRLVREASPDGPPASRTGVHAEERADAQAIAHAGARQEVKADRHLARMLTGAGLVVAAVLGPVGLGNYLGGRPPRAILDEVGRTPRGLLTIVDFVDFECPFCRMTHATLEPILDANPGRVRLVRRQVPLRIHPHAMNAARAACCGELLGKGDAMANALFSAPVEGLTREGCEKVAETVGLALEPYRACVSDPKTDARIEEDRAEFKAVGGYALPTLWVDTMPIIGAQPAGVLQRVIADALAKVGG